MFFLGLMSGTSLDGIDAAIIELKAKDSHRHWNCTLVGGLTSPWCPSLRKKLLHLCKSQASISIDELGYLDAQTGIAFAQAANTLINRVGLANSNIQAIGSHGQTIRHRPNSSPPFSMQIGDPHRIAEITGITTVSDFRRRDIAAGGQGAPLMPAFHHAMLGNSHEDRAVVNLGGIANLTLLPAHGALIGFDCGTANTLLDCWHSLHHSDELFDQDGKWAASGKIHTELLELLVNDAWFSLPPPKSTGPEYFNLDWLSERTRKWQDLRPEDVQATLVELSVVTISNALKNLQPSTKILYVAGGGCHNAYMMNQLNKQISDIHVKPISAIGLDPDYFEAMGFAWLAAQTLMNIPVNLTSVTGAIGARILGSIHLGHEKNCFKLFRIVAHTTLWARSVGKFLKH